MPLSHSLPCPKHPRFDFTSCSTPTFTPTPFLTLFPIIHTFSNFSLSPLPSPLPLLSLSLSSCLMEYSCDLKRRRAAVEDKADSSSLVDEMSFPEAKRLRADDLLIDILDEEDDAGEQDLESVMRSLEEEIGLPSPPPTEQVPAPVSGEREVVVVLEQPDLGYLFEASDDDLGLPPSVPSTSEDGGEPDVGEAPETLEEVQGFGQIWGFDDEIHCFDEFEMGARSDGRTEAAAVAEAAAAAFDGGLFDYPDVLCGLSDVADFSWRSESLPAV